MTTPLDVRVLHAVRILGYADTARIAAHLDLAEHPVAEELLDAEAYGRVTRTSFGDPRAEGGWSLTEAGKAYGEEGLAAELDASGGRALVRAAYNSFLPLNVKVTAACTAWQLGELGVEPPVAKYAVLRRLDEVVPRLAAIESQLVHWLPRFTGYHARFAGACRKALHDHRWIVGTDRDSAHTVWFQLHEDLIATLGISR